MRPAAVVAVIQRGDRILFIQRGPAVPDPGYWAPPSGAVEPGEGQEDAVVREVAEEVGLTVRPLRKVWESTSMSGTHTLHWWLAESLGGTVQLDPREASDARWVTADEIRTLEPTFAGDRAFFREVYSSL